MADAGVDPEFDGITGRFEICGGLAALRFRLVLAADHEKISWCSGLGRWWAVNRRDVPSGHRDHAGEDIRIAGSDGHCHESALGKTGQNDATVVDLV